MGEVSEESGWVRGWCRQPLILCSSLPSGQGQGRGATAVLVGRADQGSGQGSPAKVVGLAPCHQPPGSP